MSEEPELLAFCVTANVRREINRGEGGLEIRHGLKHFAGGAKVWVLPPHWGDGGDQMIVVGRHRGRGVPYFRVVVSQRYLENFRVKGIYSPALLHALTKPPKPSSPIPSFSSMTLWSTREEAEKAVARWNIPYLRAEFDSGPVGERVSDPPPTELTRDGVTYYLAHFNHRVARYSASPPPVEPPAGPPEQGGNER